jgi:hypothetical protein
MANVRIGSDGSIIKDDVVVESDGRTIIREDGTIETTSVGGHSAPPNRAPAFNAPPVSPLEQGESRSTPVNTQPPNNSTPSTSSSSQQRGGVDLKAIKEKEYDIQMMDGRIKNATPKSMIIATIVLCILGAVGLYFLFIPAVVTGIMIIVGFLKKSQLESERAQMYEELQALERGERR